MVDPKVAATEKRSQELTQELVRLLRAREHTVKVGGWNGQQIMDVDGHSTTIYIEPHRRGTFPYRFTGKIIGSVLIHSGGSIAKYPEKKDGTINLLGMVSRIESEIVVAVANKEAEDRKKESRKSAEEIRETLVGNLNLDIHGEGRFDSLTGGTPGFTLRLTDLNEEQVKALLNFVREQGIVKEKA